MTPTQQREAAAQMLRDLQENRLMVAKIANDSGYIRVTIGQNPDWYQWLCSQWIGPRNRPYRRPRTIIKRCNVIATLRRMANGQATAGLYADRVLSVMRKFWEQDRDEDTDLVSAHQFNAESNAPGDAWY